MSTRTLEIVVGFFVALGLAGLFFLAFQVSNITEHRNAQGYEVHGYFNNVGGLKVRAPVTMAGVRVGRVSDIRYDPERFQARVTLRINGQYDQLPADTQASIYTAGLLGEQYVSLEPGGEDAVLAQGDRLLFTQSAVILEELIGQFMVNMTSN